MRPGTSARAAGAEDEEGGDEQHRHRHEQGGIGEGEVDAADGAEIEEVDDRELVDRIDLVGSCNSSTPLPFTFRRSGDSLQCPSPSLALFVAAAADMRPDARMTFSTPAQKPSRSRPIRPQGDVPAT